MRPTTKIQSPQELKNSLPAALNKFVLNLKRHSCNKDKVLLNVVEITCPIQHNGIDCDYLQL